MAGPAWKMSPMTNCPHHENGWCLECVTELSGRERRLDRSVDKLCDEARLTAACHAMQGILAGSVRLGNTAISGPDTDVVACWSLRYAETLLRQLGIVKEELKP